MLPAPEFATYTCGVSIALPAARLTACGPAPSSSAGPRAWLAGSTDRMVLSASLTTSTGPVGLFGDGAAISWAWVPTSSVPDSLLAFRLASATVWASGEPSAASTLSELGAAPTAAGATSSWTVVATAAAPIGMTDSVWSSMFAVTAYSPARGNGAWRPNADCRGSTVGTGPVAWRIAVGAGVGEGHGGGVLARARPTLRAVVAGLQPAPGARA